MLFGRTGDHPPPFGEGGGPTTTFPPSRETATLRVHGVTLAIAEVTCVTCRKAVLAPVGEGKMRGSREVFEGQRFRRSGSSEVWEVHAIRKDVVVNTPHVQLCRVDDPKTLKTVALSVLFDRNQFEIAESL